jgi:hypothetical protein
VFFRHRDKNFSFTDCTSCVELRVLRVREALTMDRRFEQAGCGRRPGHRSSGRNWTAREVFFRGHHGDRAAGEVGQVARQDHRHTSFGRADCH